MKNNKSTLLYFFILFFIFFSLFIGGRLLSLKDKNTTPPYIEGVVQQKNDVVTVHNEPSPNASVLLILNNEDIVEVLNSSEIDDVAWYQIEKDHISGWVQARFITIVESEEYQINQ